MQKYIVMGIVNDLEGYKSLKVTNYVDAEGADIPKDSIFEKPYRDVISEIENNSGEYYLREICQLDRQKEYTYLISVNKNKLSVDDIEERLNKAF